MNVILEKWTQEMGIDSRLKASKRGSLTSNCYRKICKGPMADVWKFVSTHVKSVQTVNHIRRNLELRDSDNPAEVLIGVERDMLNKEKANLNSTIEKAKCALQYGRHTTFEIAKEKRKSDQDLMELQGQCWDLRQSTYLLKEFSENACSMVEKYSQKNKQLQHVLDSKAGPSGSAKESQTNIYFTRATDDYTKSPVLETACMRSVRESCEAIQNCLLVHEKISANKPDPNFNKKWKLLYSKVVALLAENRTCEILKCLNDLQQERFETLKTFTDKLDIQNDAQKLQFRYVPYSSTSDSLQDLKSDPDIFRDIKANVIVKFMELQKVRLSIKTLSTQYEFIVDELLMHLEKMFSTQPEKLILARKIMESQMGNELAKGCAEELENFRKKLIDRVQSDCKIQQVMMSKYEDIKNMQSNIKKKQEVIRTLIACNALYDSQLENQIRVILEFLENNVKNRSIHYSERFQTLQNCLTSEMEIFRTLPLPVLIFATKSDGQVVFSSYLSISDRALCRAFNAGLCETLSISNNKPPETFLPMVVSLKKNLFQIQKIRGSQIGLFNQLLRSYSCTGTANESRFTSEALIDLKKALQKKRKQQVLAGSLNQQHALLDDGFKTCLELRKQIEIWWKLPAGDIILPLQADGLDLNQFKENLLPKDG